MSGALAAATTLIIFDENSRVAFLAPLAGPPLAIQLQTRRIRPLSREQQRDVQRQCVVKARIRLLAKNDELKRVGLARFSGGPAPLGRAAGAAVRV